jgi:hypothetical protein
VILESGWRRWRAVVAVSQECPTNCIMAAMPTLQRVLDRARRGAAYGAVLAAALADSRQRAFVTEALALARELPGRLEQPLPVALRGLTPPAEPQTLPGETMRQIVDALTALGAGRPLGICLRRSLLRYYFLRRAGLPLVIHFGARRLGDDIAGHAWLTLAGQPYHERPENVLLHTLMWSYPVDESL